MIISNILALQLLGRKRKHEWNGMNMFHLKDETATIWKHLVSGFSEQSM